MTRMGMVPVAALLLSSCVESSLEAPTSPKPQPPSAVSTPVTLIGAGDIAVGDADEAATAQLILQRPSATVFTTGDNANPDGTPSDFAVYDRSWGQFKARTRPSPGNHDYHTTGAAGYFGYFGALAGPAGLGYYSYDVGSWHIISLDSEIDMSAGSPQEKWLRADLAASGRNCTLAYWHRPRFSSGDLHGSSTSSRSLWRALQDAGAEIVVCGHDHEYERFAPQDADGNPDPERGIREFVVGTGGGDLYAITTPIANSEAHSTNTHGVLELTLGDGTYSWKFIPVAGEAFSDSGSGVCQATLSVPRFDR